MRKDNSGVQSLLRQAFREMKTHTFLNTGKVEHILVYFYAFSTSTDFFSFPRMLNRKKKKRRKLEKKIIKYLLDIGEKVNNH